MNKIKNQKIKEMKTSNKTNRRFSGIIVILVLSFVAANLTAQKSYRNYTLASLGNSVVKNSKYEILHTESVNNVKFTVADKEPVENWMISPADWNAKYTINRFKEVNFKDSEMILEDWMLKVNWDENTLFEDELQIEDWMMKTDWAVYSFQEKELEFEDWMAKPASWNCVN
jgi:hypothetical protein